MHHWTWIAHWRIDDVKYRHSDVTIEAATAAEVVDHMRRGAHDPGATELEYMRAAAERAEAQSGKVIRTDTHENFVADLVGAGLLEEVE